MGIGLGMQLAIVEFARNVSGIENAHSTEIDEHTEDAIIDLLPEQKELEEPDRAFRLGSYACKLQPGTKVRTAYDDNDVIHDRDRLRFRSENDTRELKSGGPLICRLPSQDD